MQQNRGCAGVCGAAGDCCQLAEAKSACDACDRAEPVAGVGKAVRGEGFESSCEGMVGGLWWVDPEVGCEAAGGVEPAAAAVAADGGWDGGRR